MEVIDNINRRLGDDLKDVIRPGSKVRIAAATFSIYAFEALQRELSQIESRVILDRLIATWENEVVEFKRASADFDTDKIGRYISALSNEANLSGSDAGWLVFGVDDATRTVVGTDYRLEPERLAGLKLQVAQGADITIRNAHVLDHLDGRVILFEVPPAPRGIPISWKGHY